MSPLLLREVYGSETIQLPEKTWGFKPVKPDIKPTQREVALRDDEFIVSKTDLKGRITYIDRTFMGIAGYVENELLTIQHNIIRHPDMPRGVFRLLWQPLEQGKEFFGFVKNMTADGSHYWVFANVTPDYDNTGKLKGYLSVRRKPPASAIAIIDPIYKDMNDVEARSRKAEAPDASIAYLHQQLYSQGIGYEEFVFELYSGQ